MNRESRRGRDLPARGNRKNIGAYEQPFSGVGMEIAPLGSATIDTEFALHEVGFWPNDYGWNFPDTYSPFWRAYYSFDPGHSVRFGDREVAIGPDKIIVIPDHQRFDCVGDHPVAKFWIHFSCRWKIEPRTPMPIEIAVNDLHSTMLKELARQLSAGPNRDQVSIRHLATAFLVYLLSSHSIPRQQSLPSDIATLVERINQEPGYPWNNPEMAELADMTTDSFIRRFKRYVGESPLRYVQQIRVRDAGRLLTTTVIPIEEIARKTGFPDRFYFSRVFKRHTGDSPAAYRKEHLKSDD